jgi:hypothetical protein
MGECKGRLKRLGWDMASLHRRVDNLVEHNEIPWRSKTLTGGPSRTSFLHPLSHHSNKKSSLGGSLLPPGMSETASNVSQTAGRAYVPGASVKVLYEEKIALQPCCLQFSPRSPEYFVVGTYSLEDTTTQSRNGSLLLYRLHGEKL